MYWKIHKGGFSIGTRPIFLTTGSLIEIYGESHNDYTYTNENYKMLHDRTVWNTFLQILENILITILCCFISEREAHWVYQPQYFKECHYFCFTREGSPTAVNITDNIYFLLYICSLLRVRDKRKRFSFVLPLFLIKRQSPTMWKAGG